MERPNPQGPTTPDEGGPPPGADDESGSDPEPGSDPDGPGDPSSTTDEGFVPVDQLPDPLSPDDIEGMTRDEARSALSRVARARGLRLDPASAERLREEF